MDKTIVRGVVNPVTVFGNDEVEETVDEEFLSELSLLEASAVFA